MIPNMPALGVRFHIGKVESAAYGIECWKVFWRAIDIHKVANTLLFEGDTAATLNGQERVYCIAVQSSSATILSEIQAALEQSAEFRKVEALPKFVESARVVGEPLVDAGQVDSAGDLAGKAYHALAALGAVQKEKQPLPQVGQPSAPAPERKKPASSRTANLPTISSLKELLDFLLTNFGEMNKWQFWVTPEELCDIVERYADILQVQWGEDSSGLSVNTTYVTLFNKGKAGENIALHGLFPFASVSAAKQYCHDTSEHPKHLIGQLEGLFGIQGKFSTNFSGKSHSNSVSENSYKRERDIDAFDLWPRICRKREALGISLGPEPQKPAKSTTADTKSVETSQPAVKDSQPLRTPNPKDKKASVRARPLLIIGILLAIVGLCLGLLIVGVQIIETVSKTPNEISANVTGFWGALACFSLFPLLIGSGLIGISIYTQRRKNKSQPSPAPSNSDLSKPTPPISKSKQVQGVLVLTLRPLSNSQQLLQQIIDQQRSKGYSIASNFIATVGVTQNLDDEAYVYAKIRTEFSNFGDRDLMDRTRVFPFQASDDNSGNYYIVFDRP